MSPPSNLAEGFQKRFELVGIMLREGPPEARRLIRIIGELFKAVFVPPSGVIPDFGMAPRSLGTPRALPFKLRRPDSFRGFVSHRLSCPLNCPILRTRAIK